MLCLLDLLSHVIPAVRDNLDAFRVVDMALGAHPTKASSSLLTLLSRRHLSSPPPALHHIPAAVLQCGAREHSTYWYPKTVQSSDASVHSCHRRNT